MIPLKKLEAPQVLRDNAAAWTSTVVTKLAAGVDPTPAEKTRYNHPAIKAQLVVETDGKCAYCESKMRHVAPGDIEHVTPKSIQPQEWFDWNNLTLACTECNRRKGNKTGAFLDPYQVNPAEHLVFHGPMAWPLDGSPQGIYTESTLELNRPELYERRQDRLKSLLKQLDVIALVDDPDAKEALRKDFAKELESDKEYSAMARIVAATFKLRGVL